MRIIPAGIRDITDYILVADLGFEIISEDGNRFLGRSVFASIPEF